MSFGYFSPLRQNENSALLFDLGGDVLFDGGGNSDGWTAYTGLAWRHRLDEQNVFGLNAYVDLAEPIASDELVGGVSLGWEYEKKANSSGSNFLQVGGNFYEPFDDYTGVNYGSLSAAPRRGADIYASVGREFDGYSLRGTLAAYSYAATNSTEGLRGYLAQREVEYWDGLPDNSAIYGSLSFVDDNRIGTNVSIAAKIGFRWQFGRRAGLVPRRDCALIRNEDGELPTVDCTEHVLPSAKSVFGAKDGVQVFDAFQRQGVRIARPRRHLGFGTTLTPIDRPVQISAPATTGTINIYTVLYDELGFPALDVIYSFSPSGLSGTQPVAANSFAASIPPPSPFSLPPQTIIVPTGPITITQTFNPAANYSYWPNRSPGSVVCDNGFSGPPHIATFTLAHNEVANCVFTVQFLGAFP